MDPLRLHQDIMSSHETVESMLVGAKAGESKVDYNKANIKPVDEALRCPRCDSSNTKFCYYNNYSLTQPRYFCKSCRRYWTKGGTLRNVPVGGGCRKNKRSSSSKIRTIHQDHPQPPLQITPNPLLLSYDTTDLSLAFATLQNGQLGFDHDHIPMLGNYPNKPYGSCGFVETPPVNSSLQNVYYGGESFENVGQMMSEQEMGNLPYEALISGGVCTSSDETTAALTVASVKQEGCNVDSDGGDRVFCGYPWQIGGGEGVEGSSTNNFMGDVGRQSSWINGLHWHGLLNTTPLM